MNHTLLNANTLLNPKIGRPHYDPNALKNRIVHLGFGAFHRAHQAVYLDELAQQHQSDWGLTVANLHNAQPITQLKQQDLRFSVTQASQTEINSRIIGIVQKALTGTPSIIDALCAQQTQIVSLTVSEKGYYFDPIRNELIQSHPDIQHDLTHPHTPITIFGLLSTALKIRKTHHLPPLTILSCDNMIENGQKLKQLLFHFMTLTDPELADWTAQHICFPSTMVDRIVPSLTAEKQALITQQLQAIDQVGVVCEPFSQWVIENHFAHQRPAFEQVGVQIVKNVRPFEEMKLRLLNGTHSFLAYLGYLAGYEHISDCIQNHAFKQAAFYFMQHQQMPTLTEVSALFNLEPYMRQLIDRFSNPILKHRTWQVAMDGSQKIPQRWCFSIHFHLTHQHQIDGLCLGIAGWMRYISGQDEQGKTIEVQDPLKQKLAHLVQTTQDGKERVAALLNLEAIFGQLTQHPHFRQSVQDWYLHLIKHGAQKSVEYLVEKTVNLSLKKIK